MSLVVSIHDVTPAHRPAIERIWSVCVERGVIPALLVVPDWHGEWPLDLFPDFVCWLHDRAGAGADIVLHGDRHDEVGLPRATRDRLRAWGRTAGEGEFLTLGFAAARARIARGLERLRAVGLNPIGFVPPAWLIREEGYRAVETVGLGFCEDDRTVRLCSSGQRLPSPVVRWSARTALRAWGSVVVSEARWWLQRRSRLARIALHPQDLAHPGTARAMTSTLERWLGLHRTTSYGELCRREQPAAAGR